MRRIFLMPLCIVLSVLCVSCAPTVKDTKVDSQVETSLGVDSHADMPLVVDSHLHYLDFLQQTDGFEELVEKMDDAGVIKAVIFGMAMAKQ